MSLAIVITTNEGNILAADSMETYRNALGDTREGSLTRMKLFQLNDRIGVVSCGLSFLENRNIHQHMIMFKRANDLSKITVEELTDKLYDYFYEKFQEYLKSTSEKKKERFEEQGCTNVSTSINLECITVKFDDANKKGNEKKFYMPIIQFLVAGHNMDGSNYVYKIVIPDPKEKNGITLKLDGEKCGATWIGQTDILVRIVRGWSPQIKRSKYIEELPEIKRKDVYRFMDDQEYLINWGTMTIQDALDFSTLAIRTTEAIQKFTDGTWQLPGSSPGVGGPIDAAVTTPEKGFVWLQKKKVNNEYGETVDVDAFPNVQKKA